MLARALLGAMALVAPGGCSAEAPKKEADPLVPAVSSPAPVPTPMPAPLSASSLDASSSAPVDASTAAEAGVGPSPVIAAAGDIACEKGAPRVAAACHQEDTAKIVAAGNFDRVLLLGDNQYPDGTYDGYMDSFDKSWGAFKSRIAPAPGNHEYNTFGGIGYFLYFGAAAGDIDKGYYSFDLGAWHVVALNTSRSPCFPIGCGQGSAQEQWLRADLAAHPAKCTLAFWHHPRFSSSSHGGAPAVTALWQALYDGGADVVLTGHDHAYERFAPQTADGLRDDARGLREFVVGTGGKSLYAFGPAVPNSEVRQATTFGVLSMKLHPDSYEWTFLPEEGGTFQDSGSAKCH